MWAGGRTVDVTRPLNSLWGRVNLDGATARLNVSQGRAAEVTFAANMSCCAERLGDFDVDKRVCTTNVDGIRKEEFLASMCLTIERQRLKAHK